MSNQLLSRHNLSTISSVQDQCTVFGDLVRNSASQNFQNAAFLLHKRVRAGHHGQALISSVHRYWRALPKESRPRLYIHGLSLGAWSSMHGTNLFALLDDPIDGAFWVGPPFPSALWQGIVASREPGSPYVAPVLGDGGLVRFASNHASASGPDGWGAMRLAFLQYASDPIVFYELASLFRAPAWMTEAPAADVSPDMRFMPVVTQFQLAVDMALATTAPAGYGHSYFGRDYVEPWVAVTAPDSWSAADTKRLMDHCDSGFGIGCDHD